MRTESHEPISKNSSSIVKKALKRVRVKLGWKSERLEVRLGSEGPEVRLELRGAGSQTWAWRGWKSDLGSEGFEVKLELGGAGGQGDCTSWSGPIRGTGPRVSGSSDVESI